jgi:DNA helicase HerA-like ATPase
MNFEHKSQKVLIVGDSGSGKTTFWLNFVTKSEHKLKLIFDAEGEYIMRGKHGIICYEPKQLQETCERVLAGEAESNIVIFDPSIQFAGDLENGFAWFCEWVFEVSKLAPMVPKLLATDELQNLIGTDIIADSFRKVLETGRRYGLDFIAITQALNLIHNRVRNQITELVVFRTQEENALKYLKSRGFDPDEVSNLRDLNYIAKDMRGNAVSKGKLKVWKLHGKVDTEAAESGNPLDQCAGFVG